MKKPLPRQTDSCASLDHQFISTVWAWMWRRHNRAICHFYASRLHLTVQCRPSNNIVQSVNLYQSKERMDNQLHALLLTENPHPTSRPTTPQGPQTRYLIHLPSAKNLLGSFTFFLSHISSPLTVIPPKGSSRSCSR